MNDTSIIKRQFFSSIKRGTGEAHLIIKNNQELDFSNYIIKAALTDYAYNGQVEGSRALYISELIALSSERERIRKAVLEALQFERKDTWVLVQLFDLAAIFARKGDTEARKAIYKRFYKKKIKYSHSCGYSAILDLDGLDGLKYIATIIGKFLEKKPDEVENNAIISNFQDDNPSINVWKKLEEASKENRYIKIYLDNIKQTHAKWEKSYKRPVFNFEALKDNIANSNVRIIDSRYTKSLSTEEITTLADELLLETDKFKIAKYLSIFSHVKFPYNYLPILKLAKGRLNKQDGVVELAVDALKFFSAKDIREFAIAKLRRSSSPVAYTNLLITNYKKGDAKLLKSIAEKSKSEHLIHCLAASFIGIYTANKTKECREPIEVIYDKTTCGECRKEIVQLLLDNRVLSKKILREIKHDSYEETRELYIDKKKERLKNSLSTAPQRPMRSLLKDFLTVGIREIIEK
jgi:hypothetical protein